MGEGAALFVLKRLADAERDGDHIYAVLLGLGGSSDGKGKGITAPNPVGQQLAIERAWAQRRARAPPPSAGRGARHLHPRRRRGRAGEPGEVFGGCRRRRPARSPSARSSRTSATSRPRPARPACFKMVDELHEQVLAPSLNFADPNPNIDWARTSVSGSTPSCATGPTPPERRPRAAASSAFGFGGTNFHAVLEEYVPGLHRDETAPRTFAAAEVPGTRESPAHDEQRPAARATTRLRGAVVLGGRDDEDVVAQLERLRCRRRAAATPPAVVPDAGTLRRCRTRRDRLRRRRRAGAKAGKALKALRSGYRADVEDAARAGRLPSAAGPAPKVAFLYTGQGSQYVNMLQTLRAEEPIVGRHLRRGRPGHDAAARAAAARRTSSSTTTDPDGRAETWSSSCRRPRSPSPPCSPPTSRSPGCSATYGVAPGHGDGPQPGRVRRAGRRRRPDFDAALEAVSARGSRDGRLDLGATTARWRRSSARSRRSSGSSAPSTATWSSPTSTAPARRSSAAPPQAVERAVERFQAAGITAIRLPVSHAFHTSIVAPATEPLRAALGGSTCARRRSRSSPTSTGDFYPRGRRRATMVDLLGRQVASPVQFVKGLHTLYEPARGSSSRSGPKKALHGFVEDVLAASTTTSLALFTNHPKLGDLASFNQALCGLYAAGLGAAQREHRSRSRRTRRGRCHGERRERTVDLDH